VEGFGLLGILEMGFATRLDTTLQYNEGTGVESAGVNWESRVSAEVGWKVSLVRRPLLFERLLLSSGCFQGGGSPIIEFGPCCGVVGVDR